MYISHLSIWVYIYFYIFICLCIFLSFWQYIYIYVYVCANYGIFVGYMSKTMRGKKQTKTAFSVFLFQDAAIFHFPDAYGCGALLLSRRLGPWVSCVFSGWKPAKWAEKCYQLQELKSRCHSPYILVYFRTLYENLPFGIGKPSILTLR